MSTEQTNSPSVRTSPVTPTDARPGPTSSPIEGSIDGHYTELVEPLGLMRRLLAAQAAVQRVRKQKADDKDREYGYATLDQVVDACRDALIDNGLFFEIEPMASKRDVVEGGKSLLVTARVAVYVTDVQTGERIVRQTVGTGADEAPGNDALPAAISIARKLALINLLNVPMDPFEAETPSAGQSTAAAASRGAGNGTVPSHAQLSKLAGDQAKHELSDDEVQALSLHLFRTPRDELNRDRVSRLISALPKARDHFAELVATAAENPDSVEAEIVRDYLSLANGAQAASSVRNGSGGGS